MSASPGSNMLARVVKMLTSVQRFPTSAVTSAPTCGGATGVTADQVTSSHQTPGPVLTWTSARTVTGAWETATMNLEDTDARVLLDTNCPLTRDHVRTWTSVWTRARVSPSTQSVTTPGEDISVSTWR